METSFKMTPEELAQFHRDGFIGPFTVYSPDEAAQRYRAIRAELFNREHAVYDLPSTSPIANYDRHLDVNLLSEHVCRLEIVQRVTSILGADVVCWRSEMFPKYPGDEGTDWHQADTYAHASGKPQVLWPGEAEAGGAITVWTAFTEANEENGCLRFMPGTHQQMFYDESKKMEFRPEQINAVERAGMKRGFFGYDFSALQKDPHWTPDESRAVSIVLKAGQFVIFWSTVMHASFPNTTKNKTRLGYACRYVPTSVRIYPDTDCVEEYGSRISLERYGVVVVSGEDHYRHNQVVTQNARGVPFRALEPVSQRDQAEVGR